MCTHDKSINSCLVELALVVIGGNRIYSALSKALQFDKFIKVVEAHGVLSPVQIGWRYGLPILELGVGSLVIVATSKNRYTRSVTVRLISVMLVIVFSIYLSIVKEEVVQQVGCGCRTIGASTHRSSGTRAERSIALAINGLLLLLHMIPLMSARTPAFVCSERVAT